MGSHSMQAVGLALFLAGFVAIGAGLSLGGKVALIAPGVALLIVSVGVFRRLKANEAGASD
jgi:hypothetical protein